MCQCQHFRCTSERTINPVSVHIVESHFHDLGYFRDIFGPTPARNHSNATLKDAPRHSPTRAIFVLIYKRTQTRKYVTHNFLIFKIFFIQSPPRPRKILHSYNLTLLFTASHMREMWQTFRIEELSLQA